MKKYKILGVVSFLFLVCAFSLAFVNVAYLQTFETKSGSSESNEVCSSIINELKLCTDKLKVVVSIETSIVLNFTVTNTIEKNAVEKNTEKEIGSITEQEDLVAPTTRIIVSKSRIKVTDENGTVLPTKMEKIANKGSLMSEKEKSDFISSLATNHRFDNRQILQSQTVNEKLVLSDIYDFSEKGKYFVEITRKIMNPNGEGFIEIPLGRTIEIEVK
jgi:maltodextrin utilization protein YvdJ